ncbi:MAG: protein translocase subunit SecF [bacterium]|nr:protein translocase subunit SecF [bacterium]
MKQTIKYHKVIDWMKYRYLYFAFSLLFIIPGLISMALFGFKPSVDFTGGTNWEIRFLKEKPAETRIYQTLENIINVTSIISTDRNSYILKAPPLTSQQLSQAKKALESKFGPIEELREETVGPVLGKELLRKTIAAVILASTLILLYVTFRFKNSLFGISAILAMIHDSLILLGAFSLLGHFYGVEVDTLFVTAVLTILSFSVHDTIVVYDRIREAQRLYPKLSFKTLIDKAVTETWVRSLNNSLTIIFMLLALILLGGTTVKWFMVALLIGTISGTYSSTFTAAPLLYVLYLFKNKRK